MDPEGEATSNRLREPRGRRDERSASIDAGKEGP